MSNKPNAAVQQAHATMEAMHRQRINETAEAINESFNLIVLDHENRKLPEDVFRHHFLPFFTNQPVEPGPDGKPRNVIAEWVGVAGTPMARVDVVDTDGNKLFTVPPVIDSSMINLNQPGKRLANMVVDYNLHKDSLGPGSAAMYMAANIIPHAQVLTTGESHMDATQNEWNGVLNYYKMLPGGEDPNAPKKDEGNGSEDLVYE